MLNNKTIYDAMTIKLTAEDIPMEIPKLDPSIRRAPKRIGREIGRASCRERV